MSVPALSVSAAHGHSCMIFVEILEVFVMYVHILNMEACLYEILNSSPSCFVLVKEGMDMGKVSVIQITDSPCHVAHGVHHKAVVGNLFFH